MAIYYPLLSGIAVLLPQATFGVYAGVLSDNVSRVRMLGLATITWSTTTLIAGEIDNFMVFTVMRILFGFAVACINAPAFSLIRDYFPKDYRTTANSINSLNFYLGYCFSSLSLVFINLFGWRLDYDITGVIGILIGILLLTFLEEPERGRFDKPKPQVIEKPNSLLASFDMSLSIFKNIGRRRTESLDSDQAALSMLPAMSRRGSSN
mmetsp:Transcript_10493/g.17596  ORF Transcript_10493/g.17596 Transcript_10493/m.17596 type:complete len:208 (-) Transcript_10493:839-1462(-)